MENLKFKETKGKWTVSHGAEMLPSIVSKELHLPIAHLCKVSDTMNPFDEESEANAKLISAAPELLKACDTMRRWIECKDEAELDLNLEKIDELIKKTLS